MTDPRSQPSSEALSEIIRQADWYAGLNASAGLAFHLAKHWPKIRDALGGNAQTGPQPVAWRMWPLPDDGRFQELTASHSVMTARKAAGWFVSPLYASPVSSADGKVTMPDKFIEAVARGEVPGFSIAPDNPMLTFDSADIYSPASTKVRYTGRNGTEANKAWADKHLTVDAIYTIERTEVGDWHTDFYFIEIPGRAFNSVHFATLAKIDAALRSPDVAAKPTASDAVALADKLKREVKVRRDHPDDYDEEITSWIEQAEQIVRSSGAAQRGQERCLTCDRTDKEYRDGSRACPDPWHGDDHLRAKASALPSANRACTCGGDMAHDYHQEWCPARPSAEGNTK